MPFVALRANVVVVVGVSPGLFSTVFYIISYICCANFADVIYHSTLVIYFPMQHVALTVIGSRVCTYICTYILSVRTYSSYG